MSYVAVTVVLKDGRRYDDVIVDSEHALHIRSVDGVLFEAEDIDRIVVTHTDLLAAFAPGLAGGIRETATRRRPEGWERYEEPTRRTSDAILTVARAAARRWEEAEPGHGQPAQQPARQR